MDAKTIKSLKSTEHRKILFDYWKDVPVVKFLDSALCNFSNQGVRGAILDLLREGIEDEASKGKLKTRHVLNAQEIKNYLDDRIETELKLTNVYFHLGQLKEKGFIKEVISIPKGRHKVLYFGRTAKLFFFIDGDPRDQKENFKIETRFPQLSEFIESINPDLTREKVKQLFNEYYQYQKALTDVSLAWIEKYAETLTEKEIDVLKMFDFLQTIQGYDERGRNLHAELAKVLKFP